MSWPTRGTRRGARAGALVALLVAVPAAGPSLASAVASPVAPGRAAPSAAAVQHREWWLDTLHVRSAWKITKGKNVVVGLVDSGVDGTHPDLLGALVPGKDFSGAGAPNGEAPVRDQEHGTTMAGYIVGRGHGPGGRLGLLGVAPEAKVLPAALDTQATDTGANPADVDQGIRWSVDHGAKVINLSLGSGAVTSADRSAFAYAEAHDVVVVAATGNDGQRNSISDVATLPGVVAVSGFVDDPPNYTLDADSDATGPKTLDPSSTKAADYQGGVVVSGPFETTDGGLDMVGLTTVRKGSYTAVGGTSNATAVVSGVVALIRSAHPNWSAAQVTDALIHTAYRPPGNGYSPLHGFGIPDAAAAVSAPTPSVCENPLGSLVTDSAGIWPTIVKNSSALTYVPKCSSAGSSTAPASSAPAPASSGATSSPASPPSRAAGAGDSSGGVPGWVWIVVAVVVVGGAATVLLLRRGRGGPPPPPGPGGPPGGWPQQPPPPGWSPPAPGWQQPPQPQGGWAPPPGHGSTGR